MKALRPRTGVLVFLAYLVVFYGVWIFNGIDYDHINQNAHTVWVWYVAPLAAGAAFLVVCVSALHWWRATLFEAHKAGPRWLLVGPIFMFLAAVVTILAKDHTWVTNKIFWLVVLGSVGVGFCEEMASRGVLLVGFRGGQMPEAKVWFLTSLLFGLLHLPNAVFGAGPGAVGQVVLAFMSGSMLYLTRRLTGTLVWAMLLHGFWDFSTFIGKGDNPLPLVLTLVNAVLALLLVAILLRGEKGRVLPLVGSREERAVPAAA